MLTIPIFAANTTLHIPCEVLAPEKLGKKAAVLMLPRNTMWNNLCSPLSGIKHNAKRSKQTVTTATATPKNPSHPHTLTVHRQSNGGMKQNLSELLPVLWSDFRHKSREWNEDLSVLCQQWAVLSGRQHESGTNRSNGYVLTSVMRDQEITLSKFSI